MNQKYSFSELIKTAYSWLMTKLFYPSARLIRRPFYQRGGGGTGVEKVSLPEDFAGLT